MSATSSAGSRLATGEEAPDAYGDLQTVEAWIGGGPGPLYAVTIDLLSRQVTWTSQECGCNASEPATRRLSAAERDAFLAELRAVDPLRWKARYEEPDVLDGTVWAVTLTTDTQTTQRVGKNAYPRTWQRFRRLVEGTAGHTFR